MNVRVAATASANGGTCTSVIAIPIATSATDNPVLTSPAAILATEGSGLVWRAVAAATATWNGVGMMPCGLSLDAGSGELTGIPAFGAAAGQYDILLDAINLLTSAVRTTTQAVRVLPGTPLAPTITAIAPPPLTVGAPAVIAMQTADGTPTTYALIDSSGTFGSPFEWTVVGRPAWLNLDPATSTLSGTPTTTDVTAPFILQVAARNVAGTANSTMVVSFGSTGGTTASGGGGNGGTGLLIVLLALGLRPLARRR